MTYHIYKHLLSGELFVGKKDALGRMLVARGPITGIFDQNGKRRELIKYLDVKLFSRSIAKFIRDNLAEFEEI